MTRLAALFKTWILDGWLTEGPQIGCAPGEVRAFATCIQCHAVFPHWLASMTSAEAKARGHLGCACGGMRIQPVMLPRWKAVWWFVVRGWLVRHVFLKRRLWDPRMPVRWETP